MNPLADDDLKRFAELGGWRWANIYGLLIVSTDTSSWIMNPEGISVIRLTDFRTDLQACFDVLERFISVFQRGELNHYYGLVQQVYGTPDRLFACYIAPVGYGIFESAGSPIKGEGITRQEAIIRAVLSAAKLKEDGDEQETHRVSI